MKKVNLEKILKVSCDCRYLGKQTHEEVLQAMKEACIQTLELAAEKAEARATYKRDLLDGNAEVDKQSILNTINLIQ